MAAARVFSLIQGAEGDPVSSGRPPGKKAKMKKRRWLLWAGLLGLGVLVFAHFTSLRSLIAQLGNARWAWVLVAALLHILYFGVYAVMYHEGFRVVEVESQVGALVPLVFAAIFANAVLPSGGAAAAALFIDDAERRGKSGAR